VAAEPRIERIEVDGAPAWRKSYGNPQRRARMALLRWLARRLGLNALIAPVPLAATAACATEAGMIERLAGLGLRVPAILERGPTHLVLSDLGPTLALACKREPDPERRAALLRAGFEALLDLHRRGGYASQAVARNLTLSGEGVGFIDLEEDPALMMSLAAAQARDALLFVQSSARFLLDHPARYSQLLRDYLAQESPAVRAEIGKTARRLHWLAWTAALGGARGRAFAMALSQLALAVDQA
jgi:hypothetical protein